MKNRLLILITFVLISLSTSAAYNANMSGVVKGVFTYTDGDYIYFVLENQPKSHPTCKPDYFVISETIPHQRRQMLLSRLLAAYAMKENVNIGYDSQGNCVHGFIRVHRIG